MTFEEWEWDGEGWGRARLSRDKESGACVVTIDGYDPFELGDCSSTLVFEAENYEGDYLYAICKQCKCDERGCGNWCLAHGFSHSNCQMLPPHPTHYGVGPLDAPKPGQCYPSPAMLQLIASRCRWEEAVPEGMVIFDIASGILQYQVDGYTIIWRVSPDFDPLCISPLFYDPQHPLNNPPPHCDVVRVLCVSPSSVCCDNQHSRPVSMPNRLYATLDYCCGTQIHLEATFELNWNASTGRWESEEFVLCNHFRIRCNMRCNCGTESGCFWCYPVDFWVNNFLYDMHQDMECSCYPFETTHWANWSPCDAIYAHSATLVVTE